MEQVIGFRIGATIWNDGAGGVNTTYTPYYYDPATFPFHPNDYSLVRSLRLSLIGRTRLTRIRITLDGYVLDSNDPNISGFLALNGPNLLGLGESTTYPSYTFRNTFDNGPYQIQGNVVVVNPRNMSMND